MRFVEGDHVRIKAAALQDAVAAGVDEDVVKAIRLMVDETATVHIAETIDGLDYYTIRLDNFNQPLADMHRYDDGLTVERIPPDWLMLERSDDA